MLYGIIPCMRFFRGPHFVQAQQNGTSRCTPHYHKVQTCSLATTRVPMHAFPQPSTELYSGRLRGLVKHTCKGTEKEICKRARHRHQIWVAKREDHQREDTTKSRRTAFNLCVVLLNADVDLLEQIRVLLLAHEPFSISQ